MARKKQTAEEAILDGFEGSYQEGSWKGFTEGEFIGYITAVTKLQNLSNLDASVEDILNEARRLFGEGRLSA